MEKVAAPAGASGTLWTHVAARRCLALAAVACVALPCAAQQAKFRPDGAAPESRPEAPVRVEVNATTLPRLEAQDTGFGAPRIDFSVLPAGESGLGPLFGMSTPRPLLAATGLNPSRSSVDLGLRYSHKLQSQQQVDVMAWRRMSLDDDAYALALQRQPVYGARVEMNLTSGTKTGLMADRGFIGMQLESGARITFKRKDGRPMMYYRTSF